MIDVGGASIREWWQQTLSLIPADRPDDLKRLRAVVYEQADDWQRAWNEWQAAWRRFEKEAGHFRRIEQRHEYGWMLQNLADETLPDGTCITADEKRRQLPSGLPEDIRLLNEVVPEPDAVFRLRSELRPYLSDAFDWLLKSFAELRRSYPAALLGEAFPASTSIRPSKLDSGLSSGMDVLLNLLNQLKPELRSMAVTASDRPPSVPSDTQRELTDLLSALKSIHRTTQSIERIQQQAVRTASNGGRESAESLMPAVGALKSAKDADRMPDAEGEMSDTSQQGASNRRLFDLLAQLNCNTGEVVKLSKVLCDAKLNADTKCRQACELMPELWLKDSPWWARLLDVTPQAITKTDFWKNDRRCALEQIAEEGKRRAAERDH